MLWQRGKSYSQDLRERVFAAADDGEPVGRIATMLRVSVSYVSKVLSRRRLTGQRTARLQTCHMTPKLSGLHAAVLAQVTRRPDATIAELRAWLLETHKVSASTGLMNKTLTGLDLTFKKRARIGDPPGAVETDRARVGQRGAAGSFLVDLTPLKNVAHGRLRT
jgi:transposase